MNKFFIITSYFFIAILTSCKKDSVIQEATLLSKIALTNKIPEEGEFRLLIDNQLISQDLKNSNTAIAILPEGDHQITLKNDKTNTILLDTLLIVSANGPQNYNFFRASPEERVQLLQPPNIDTVSAPAEGYLKISLANFTKHLPDNIEIVFVADDPLTGEADTAAMFVNPGKVFSGYKTLKMLPGPGGQYVNGYRIVLRDAETKSEIAFMTDPVTGEPLDWSWVIWFEADLSRARIYSIYLYSVAEDSSAPTHFSTYVKEF